MTTMTDLPPWKLEALIREATREHVRYLHSLGQTFDEIVLRAGIQPYLVRQAIEQPRLEAEAQQRWRQQEFNRQVAYAEQQVQENEPKIARHLIRQLLRYVHPSRDEDQVVKDARRFINGIGRGRGSHFNEENEYVSWRERGYRYSPVIE